jgi:glycosyltransferase involved in cell wall biosynthesis
MSPRGPKISAFIVCMNEEQQIRRCLESIKWCDEIVIIDSGSTDKTLDICREYTDRIFVRPWPGFVAQKGFGLEQCRGEWVLNLDADEAVTPELRDEMLAAVTAPGDYNGFYLLRVVFYLGKFWRKGGWYPEYRLRLCRRAVTTWGGSDPHEKAIVEGATTRLNSELWHFTYDNISNQIRSLNKFASDTAATLYGKGKRFSVSQLILNPIARFIKFYVFRKGYKEGFRGFLVAIFETFYVFLKYAKLWELSQKKK